ncbi:MAG: hypothetical protein RL213_1785 [Bacteroidota bacterium]|jgi:hypothetical protein
MRNSLLLIGMLGALASEGQQATTTSGGNASGQGGTVSYTVGEVAASFSSGSNGQVAAGVQQPYLIQSVGIRPLPNHFLTDVYPNPTTSDLTLTVSDFQSNRLSCKVIDALGQTVLNRELEGPQTLLQTGHLPASVYYVQVLEGDRIVRSFRVVKY